MNNILRLGVMVFLVVSLVLLGNNQIVWADTAKQGTVPGGGGKTVRVTGPGIYSTYTGEVTIQDWWPDKDEGWVDIIETNPASCAGDLGELPGTMLPLSGCIRINMMNNNGGSIVPFPRPIQICFPAPFLTATFFNILQWVTPPGEWKDAPMYMKSDGAVKMLCTDASTPGPYILAGH